MGRLACLSLPALPLQLLLRQHPDWRARPVAVVAEDKTQGLILYVNRAAAEAGVRPGWRYGAALTVLRELRAGVVADAAVAEEVARLAAALQRFTPQVEPSREEPGVFWLGAAGLRRIAPDLGAWAKAVLSAMGEAGFTGALVVGFTRFGAYALSRVRRGAAVLDTPAAEREQAARVPLARVALEPPARERLEQLGIRTVGEFAALPEAGILERFGPAAHRLHRLARSTVGVSAASPRGGAGSGRPRDGADGTGKDGAGKDGAGGIAPGLDPAPLREPAAETILLEYPEADQAALLFLIKSRLHGLLGVLAARRQGLAALELELRQDGDTRPAEQADPTEGRASTAAGQADPAERQASPAERQASPAERQASPAERQTNTAEDRGYGAANAPRSRLEVRDSAAPEDQAPGGARVQRLEVRTAAPTLDGALVLDLVRLRLEGVTLEEGVVAIALLARGGPAPMEQLRLFSEHPRRDLRAGAEALARLRAEFGEAAVARAALKEGHLPEAQFAWEPVERLAFPARRDPAHPAEAGPTAAGGDPTAGLAPPRALVRRLYAQARALPSPERNVRDGTFVAGQVRGAIVRRIGPYLVSGGWWAREVRRDYYYAETVQGEVLWLYYDRRRRRWFLQGKVE